VAGAAIDHSVEMVVALTKLLIGHRRTDPVAYHDVDVGEHAKALLCEGFSGELAAADENPWSSTVFTQQRDPPPELVGVDFSAGKPFGQHVFGRLSLVSGARATLPIGEVAHRRDNRGDNQSENRHLHQCGHDPAAPTPAVPHPAVAVPAAHSGSPFIVWFSSWS
jgi:hypothetical protein